MSKQKLASIEVKTFDEPKRFTPVENKTARYSTSEYWRYINREED